MIKVDEFIERRIVTGMIVSTKYLQAIAPIWSNKLLNSNTANTLANWCMEYFTKYNEAPKRNLEGIYTQKIAEGLTNELSEEIGDILNDLSDEFSRRQFNVDYLLDQTWEYFQRQHLKLHIEELQDKLATGNLTEAHSEALKFHPLSIETNTIIDPFNDLDRVRSAFAEKNIPLIHFPKTLGKYWNDHLLRDNFIAFLGPEKSGKTFLLLEFAMRGLYNDCNVAFFQAGDMTEAQLIRRIGIYLTKKSDKEKYCGSIYIPIHDCIRNQKNICTSIHRESKVGVFSRSQEMKSIGYDELVIAYRENKNKRLGYRACHNCDKNLGTPWLKIRPAVDPLTLKEVLRKFIEFRTKYKKRMKIATYPNETLTMSEIKTILENWERQENFIPDLIIIDYADIMAPDKDCYKLDFRNQQNKIWQRMRKLSQEKHCLLVTATQAAASSYKHDTLKLEDFSEDKRKYAHVTAMYGLNQNDKERKLGLMRLNELVVREGSFDRTNEICLLQRLEMGRPFIGSFKKS